MRALAIALLVAAPASAQTLSNPVGCDGCIAGWFYFDNDGRSGVDQDWSCASQSYDGHRGSDFSLSGGNGAIDGGHPVVAAAAGTVVSTLDGNYDRCTSCPASGASTTCGLGFGGGYGNHVVVNHGSYRVIYAHLRQGSIRVGPGDAVACGDVVGQIASSGCSSGAHLHFETRPLGGASTMAFDPFAGGCSPTSPSRWTSQGSHRGMPGRECGAPVPTCPSGTYPIWTCDAARTERRRCIDGVDTIEACPWGCQSMPVGTDDACAPAPDADGDGARADVDCDDADPGRRPGLAETCGDGVDQDCDGADLACPGTDGGPSPVDAGSSRDAGVGVDAGARRDAGAMARDAAVAPGVDAGPGGEGELTGTCGCRAIGGGSSGSLALLLPFALFMLRRR